MSSTPCKVVSQKEKTCPIKLCRNLDHDGIIVSPFSQHFFHQQRSPKRRPSILFLFNEGKERVYPVSVLWFLNNFLNDAIARCFHLHSQLRCDLQAHDNHRFFTVLIISLPDHAASWFSGTNDHWFRFWCCPGGFCLHMYNTLNSTQKMVNRCE